MKTKLQKVAWGAMLFSGTLLNAQTNQPIQPCNTYAAMEDAFQKNPGARERYENVQAKLYEEYQNALNNQQTGKTTAPPQYTIPVVFHVLHQGGAENISDATINAALAQVNSDFARTGPDVNTIFAPFQALYVNSEVTFKLAHKDPNGNCTSGIVRRYDSRTNWDQGNTSNYNGITWDPTKYLNIIIVRNIIPQGSVVGGGIIVGYTYKPSTWPTGASQDAIVYNYGFLSGMIPARSLTHEIGHWFNLSHTFGNTNNPGVTCGDDLISDTPPTKGNFSSCPASSTNSTVLCASNQNPYYQNVENIMDYSSCPKNFTQGQTTVMRTAIASSNSGRNNLWSATNLTATDVNGTGICAPIANFASNTTFTVCSNGTLLMKDFSYNGTVTGYTWTANNGAVIASPNSANTNITFPNVGTTAVTLSVSNTLGGSVVTKNVTVLNGLAQVAGAYSESFEGTGLPTNWAIINQTGGTTWQQTTLGAATGSKSYMIDGTINPNSAIDIMETPSYDFLNNPTIPFTFRYAYARYSATHADVFKVQASDDCGGTWTDIYVPTMSSLSNGSGGISTTPFVPTASQFKTYTLSNHPGFSNYLLKPNVRLRFYFQEDAAAGFGNRMYLDDINFSAGTSGINELSQSIGLSLYPNPAKGSTILSMHLSNTSELGYTVIDLTGRTVYSAPQETYTAGEHGILIDTRALKPGVYFVNINLNGTTLSRKLLVD
ncbi:MAG: M43 family zinc metalloprotease [Sediminibacterium sp.]|nr:M43 family zinc metalloprotease [Sediminibacterium sp.]